MVTGSKLVLIDTGAAGLFGPTLGNLQTNLKAAGYQPEQVDEIYLTHMHPDHVGGLIANGAIAFPNAKLRIDKADVDFWLDHPRLLPRSGPSAPRGRRQGLRVAAAQLHHEQVVATSGSRLLRSPSLQQRGSR